jgi:hypothetical protein
MELIDEPPSQRLEVRRCGWLVASTLIPPAALLACILYFEVCSGAAFDVGYCYRALSTKWQTPFAWDSDKLAKRSCHMPAHSRPASAMRCSRQLRRNLLNWISAQQIDRRKLYQWFICLASFVPCISMSVYPGRQNSAALEATCRRSVARVSNK